MEQLRSFYDRFTARISQKINKQIYPSIDKIDKGDYQPVPEKELKKITLANNKVYSNARKSYTKN